MIKLLLYDKMNSSSDLKNTLAWHKSCRLWYRNASMLGWNFCIAARFCLKYRHSAEYQQV